MTFADLRNIFSYRQIADGTTINFSNLYRFETTLGFSANAARQLKKKYPELDLNDLLTNYPQKPRNITYD